ncbi:MAG TPA: hypothetical protein VK590_09605 [Saprospiraceae bacterium]|nr:hypothetical protein [Saprospiraceae bacterium]
MKNLEDIKLELEEIAPTLAGLSKPRNPKVPELYFEGFANRLIHNMELDTSKVTQPVKNETILNKLWWFFAQPRYALTSAASVLILISGMFVLQTKHDTKTMAVNVSQEEAQEYIVQNIEQFDTKSLVDEDLSETEVNSIMNESLPEEEVKQIINENIENLNIEDLL